MAKKTDSFNAWSKSFNENIEYKMSKEMSKQILATRKGLEQNMNPQEFLCKVVNEDFGLKGNCVRVLIS